MALFFRHKKPGPLKPTANPYPSRFQSWRLSFGVTFFFLILVGGALRFYGPFYQSLQQSLFEGSAWVQAFFIQPLHGTTALLQDTKTFVTLKDEHARLLHENEELKWQVQALNQQKYENESLRKTLQVPAVLSYSKQTAAIISSPYDGLHHFFLIKSGTNDGLEKNQAVVSPEGVIGRLEKVGAHISRVLLLNDASSRIPVKTLQSEQMAILAGDGSFFPALVYVTDVRKVLKGEQVVTSGLGGIFPAGLPVGKVDNVVGGKIIVRPFVPFQKIEWVYVLNPVSEKYIEELDSAMEGE